MNWGALKTAGVWAHAAASAAIVGAADAAANLVFAPPFNWRTCATVAAVGALRATFMHLKKSPLPPLKWPDPEERERGASVLPAMAALIALIAMVVVGHLSYVKGRADGFELGLFETTKRYAEGLREGAHLCTPSDPLASVDRCGDLVVCRERVADLEAEEESNVEAIAAAHERGWEEAYRLGREDWTVQRWECPRGGLR